MAREKKLRGRDTKPAGLLFCSFCGKDAKSVKTLVQGPSAFICNECVSVCQKVLRGQMFPGFPSLEKVSNEQLLSSLQCSSQAVRDVVKKTVNTLRARKVGWAAIGKALGVSRQAAWQRFS
jgi:ATP-dependent protease Clp ATPase subunit